MESDPRRGFPASSPNTWHSPAYRGGGGQRFRGHKDDSFSPRPSWRGQNQWTPSPYRNRGGYRPNYRNSGPYTPRRGSPGFGYQEPYRPRYSSPRFHSTPYNNQNDIENWISPQMWQDPWESLLRQTSYHPESFDASSGVEPYTPEYTPESRNYYPQRKQEPNLEESVKLDANTVQSPAITPSRTEIVADLDVLIPNQPAAAVVTIA